MQYEILPFFYLVAVKTQSHWILSFLLAALLPGLRVQIHIVPSCSIPLVTYRSPLSLWRQQGICLPPRLSHCDTAVVAKLIATPCPKAQRGTLLHLAPFRLWKRFESTEINMGMDQYL